MQLPYPIPVKDLARMIGASTLIGDDTLTATGINEIHKVVPGDIMFVDLEKYFDKALKSAATIIILNQATECPSGKVLLVCERPFEAYDGLVRRFRPFTPLRSDISESAEIDPTAIIEPGVVIGPYARIGKGAYIAANAYIGGYCIIGEEVVIQPGAQIGVDAFYFKKYPDQRQRWRSGGRVIIEARAEIGAGCTISRGVSGDTIIGEGSKLDCQCHIGHGVVLGKNCLLAAQVGIGGKTIVGDNAVFYGQVGIVQNLRIGNDVTILGQSGISKDLEEGKTYFGSPAREARQAYKEMAAVRRISYEL